MEASQESYRNGGLNYRMNPSILSLQTWCPFKLDL